MEQHPEFKPLPYNTAPELVAAINASPSSFKTEKGFCAVSSEVWTDKHGSYAQTKFANGWSRTLNPDGSVWSGPRNGYVVRDAQPAAPAALIRKQAHKQEPDPQLGKGDAQGIERFVAPPAPEPVKEKVRVSTWHRRWAGFSL